MSLKKNEAHLPNLIVPFFPLLLVFFFFFEPQSPTKEFNKLRYLRKIFVKCVLSEVHVLLGGWLLYVAEPLQEGVSETSASCSRLF